MTSALAGVGLRASAVEEEEDDLDGFIDDSVGAEDWRSELQAVTGYDPSKCAAASVLSQRTTLHTALALSLA